MVTLSVVGATSLCQSLASGRHWYIYVLIVGVADLAVRGTNTQARHSAMVP